MKKALFILAFLFSGSALAGYAVSVTNSSFSSAPVGGPTGCYYTVSMAVYSVSWTIAYVTAIDDSAHTWAGKSSSGLPVSGTFQGCSSAPLSGIQSTPLPGVSDPGLSGSSLNGSGASSAVSQPLTAADWALLGIDSPTILSVWLWGFASVMGMWFFGYVVGVARSMIRQI
jgi:hypothetical protein